MKLCTFKYEGIERVGVALNSEQKVADITAGYAAVLKKKGKAKVYELANVLTPPSMRSLVESEEDGINAVREVKEQADARPEMTGANGERIVYSLDEVKILAPITNPSKMLAVVMNMQTGTDLELPAEWHPLYFIKLPSSIIGPHDDLEILDYKNTGGEPEICAVIGKKGRYIPENEVNKYIFGYVAVNDVTAHGIRQERDWVATSKPDGVYRRSTYPGRYKNYDTFCPMGPWIVTPDEIKDLYKLHVTSYFEGEKEFLDDGMMEGHSFKFPTLISYFSEAHTLMPGDLIFSGTVPGVDKRGAYPEFRKAAEAGKVLITTIEQLGTMRNPLKPIPLSR